MSQVSPKSRPLTGNSFLFCFDPVSIPGMEIGYRLAQNLSSLGKLVDAQTSSRPIQAWQTHSVYFLHQMKSFRRSWSATPTLHRKTSHASVVLWSGGGGPSSCEVPFDHTLCLSPSNLSANAFHSICSNISTLFHIVGSDHPSRYEDTALRPGSKTLLEPSSIGSTADQGWSPNEYSQPLYCVMWPLNTCLHERPGGRK